MRWTFTSIALLAAVVAGACDDGGENDPCQYVTCSGHGICVVLDGVPGCDCDPGYKPGQLSCLALAPCEEETCSGHGTCQVVDGREVCECDPGYEPDGLTCMPDGECQETGLDCIEDRDCCGGHCLRYTGDPLGYCTEYGCRCDTDCINHADDDAYMCCVDVGGEDTLCMKILAGYICANEITCGYSCTDGSCSNCLDCVPGSDGSRSCTHGCSTDSDCGDCYSGSSPPFTCQTTPDGASYCLPDLASGCTSSQDCKDDEVCIPWIDADGQGMEGTCNRLGELPIGSACDSSANPNDQSPDERCAGFYCLWDHCTGVCGQNADCPDGMVCNETFFCMDANCETTASIGTCKWMCCGLVPCDSNADCPDGQICDYYLSPNGEITKVCAEQRCDPATQDCGDFSDACEDDSPDCATGVCIDPDLTGTGLCSALCAADDDCPEPMVCQPSEVATGPFGTTITINACRPPE